MPADRPRLLGWGWLTSLISSVSLGTLIFLNTLLVRDAELPVLAPPTPQPNWAVEFQPRIERVTDALTHLPMALPTPRQALQGAGALRWVHRRYDVTLPVPEAGAVERLLEPIRSAAPGVTVQINRQAAGAQVQIGVDGLLTHTLALHWLARRARVAIIIGDLGNDLLTARSLTSIGAALTFAVMPFRPFSREVAELAALFQREVLLHLPMESESGVTFGASNVLRTDASRSELEQVVDASIAAVPHAVGVNGHMGSRLTTDRQRMQWVLGRLKEKGLFFIDSRTTSESVACAVATELAVPCVGRNLFLDDVDDEQAIGAQLEAVLQLAQIGGDAIAIGHPRLAMVAALQRAVPAFAAAGVDIVPASAIVTDTSLSSR